MCFSATASYAAGTVLLGAAFSHSAWRVQPRSAPNRHSTAVRAASSGLVVIRRHPGLMDALTRVYSPFRSFSGRL